MKKVIAVVVAAGLMAGCLSNVLCRCNEEMGCHEIAEFGRLGDCLKVRMPDSPGIYYTCQSPGSKVYVLLPDGGN